MSGILLSSLPRDVRRIFHWRAKTEEPKAESGVRFLGRGQHSSNPIPHQLGGAVSSPSELGADLRSPKGFPLFSALKMTSPDIIILLIVDYHAAIGAKFPVPPCKYIKKLSYSAERQKIC